MTPGDVNMLNVKQVAQALAVTPRTIWRWAASDPHFPRPITLGEKCVRWRLRDVKWFIDRRAGEAADTESAGGSELTGTYKQR